MAGNWVHPTNGQSIAKVPLGITFGSVGHFPAIQDVVFVRVSPFIRGYTGPGTVQLSFDGTDSFDVLYNGPALTVGQTGTMTIDITYQTPAQQQAGSNSFSNDQISYAWVADANATGVPGGTGGGGGGGGTTPPDPGVDTRRRTSTRTWLR